MVFLERGTSWKTVVFLVAKPKGAKMLRKHPFRKTCGLFQVIRHIFSPPFGFSPNSVVTLGVLTVSDGKCKRPGWLDRGGGRVVHRFHRYFGGFVLACSFRL